MNRLILPYLAVALLCAAPAGADWNPGQDAKWVQLPDLTPSGIDVNDGPFGIDGTGTNYILADDWLCTSPERITGIHFWGSWLNDALPEGDPSLVTFTLSIHADIPADQNPDGYSMPGEVLWMQTFQPGSFLVRPYEEGILEGWLDPPERYLPPPADTICWQYDFFIDDAIAFRQEGTEDNPIVYWLDVQAHPVDEAMFFGWKTSVDQWNDAAVFGQGLEPYPGPWRMLIYPPDHEQAGQRIDLAFALEGVPFEPEFDFGDAPDSNYHTLLASDGARHRITDLFLGATVDPEPDGQPGPLALGDDLDAVLDDEDGVTFLDPLRPGADVRVEVVVSQDSYLDAWIDFNCSGHWTAPDRIFNAEPVFATAVPNTLVFHIPAWARTDTLTCARFRVSHAGGLGPDGIWPTGQAPAGEVEDYRVLLEDRWAFKWRQPPDLSPLGIDVAATADATGQGFILADDWLCTREGPVTNIHVWGSWLHDYLPMNEDPLAVEFTLSIHADIPAEQSSTGYSMPGELLWEYRFPAGAFEVERFAAEIEEGWMRPPDEYVFPADWTCWLYRFRVPEEMAFFQRGTPEEPVIYWLDLQAQPLDPQARFGWKTSTDHWNDDAVWGLGMEPYPGPWGELRYPPGHELQGRSIDLAFALFERPWSAAPDEAPERSGLLNNTPNPFNPSTTIHFVMPPEGGTARIDVFDARGRKVATLLDGFVDGGERTVTWDGRADDGRDLPSGVYFYRLHTAAGEGQALKMLLLR